ncbi:hypothetical protein [Streptomyces oceani]|uniref:Uncharacterized protein n=1 Tax=Streptomyces oceani TaxID=1075402 RepID=A0A1E7JVB0_9ACTN|nr:hypothetical protein [Streptomyces oceani]OEU94383.1 hypothetical protein AN216_24385 [Streptomyces oceani]
MFRKSFYDLAFGVDPGGARKDTHYVRGSLDEIKADLDAELTEGEGINLYLLCWYGARLALDVYQHGERSRSIDLHPFVTISVEGYPDITFTGPEEPVGYDFSTEEESSVAEGSLSDRMFGGLGDSFSVAVAWDRIDVPPLVGEVAGPDDLVSLENEWALFEGDADWDTEDLLESGFVPYGYSDGEE